MAASWPTRTSSRASSTTCFWAPPSVSSLIMNSTRIVDSVSFGAALQPAVAPHLEGEQQPDLLHVEPVVGRAAIAEVRHRFRRFVGIDQAAGAHALAAEVFVEQPRQLAAQPRGERDREALLRPVDELARDMAIEDLAQEVLGAQRSAAQRERQAQREFGEAMVEERIA